MQRREFLYFAIALVPACGVPRVQTVRTGASARSPTVETLNSLARQHVAVTFHRGGQAQAVMIGAGLVPHQPLPAGVTYDADSGELRYDGVGPAGRGDGFVFVVG